MPRTTLPTVTAPGPRMTSGVVLTMTAIDTVNGNQFKASGNDLVIVRNSGASAYTFTYNSAAEGRFGRKGDITAESLAAGEVRIYGPATTDGWAQPDGYVYLNGSNASLLVGVIRL